MSWKNLSLLKKFAFGLGAVFALASLALFLYDRQLRSVAAESERVISVDIGANDRVQGAQAAVLQCRRDEKDFLLRKDAKYIAAHAVSCSKLLAEVDAAAGLFEQGALRRWWIPAARPGRWSRRTPEYSAT